MFRQRQLSNDSTLREDCVLPSLPHSIFFAVKKLYGVVVMLLFSAIALVALLVSTIIAAMFSPAGTPNQSSSSTSETNEPQKLAM
ncbi:MAG: hypothetical protein F6K14_23580 [Symploca sp. SIO2C1]|nr:hypothetical protein [Symploca sp. SIO2C1]